MKLTPPLKREIEAPVKGERMVFVKTAEDTNGEYLEFDHYIQPGKGYSPDHVHEIQDEYYDIISGEATYKIEDKVMTAKAGETVIIRKGQSHVNPWNNGKEPLHIHRKTTPEGGAQLFFVTWYALDRAGGKYLMKDSREMGLFQIAVIGTYLPAQTFIARFPMWLQKPGLHILAFIGRLMGRKPRYPELE